MSLSIIESEKLRKLVSSVKERLIREQNIKPHSAASTRIVESSNPSWSSIPGIAFGFGQISESTSMKRKKRKKRSRRLEDAIQKHLDEILC